jgi:hypothetical protein
VDTPRRGCLRWTRAVEMGVGSPYGGCPPHSKIEMINYGTCSLHWIRIRIPNMDPDPGQPKNADLHGPGSISMRYGSGSGSFYNQAKILRKTLIPAVFLLFMTFYLEAGSGVRSGLESRVGSESGVGS